jgi:hypothetical protein
MGKVIPKCRQGLMLKIVLRRQNVDDTLLRYELPHMPKLQPRINLMLFIQPGFFPLYLA